MIPFILLADLVLFSLSAVMIEPGREPGVVAVVTFNNTSTNTGPEDQKVLTLETEIGLLLVPVTFGFNTGYAGADSIILEPPAGLTCVPVSCKVEVLETFSAEIKLIEYLGM